MFKANTKRTTNVEKKNEKVYAAPSTSKTSVVEKESSIVPTIVTYQEPSIAPADPTLPVQQVLEAFIIGGEVEKTMRVTRSVTKSKRSKPKVT